MTTGTGAHESGWLLLVVFVFFIASCWKSQKDDLVVVSKTLMKRTESSTAVPLEFGGFAAASSTIYWVEGKVKNAGMVDAKKVVLSFQCTTGAETRVLMAELANIPAGKTMDFKTEMYQSKVDLRLPADEQPEITCE